MIDEGIYKEIKEQGDNAYNIVKEINNKREERYKEYRSICEDIQLLFEYEMVLFIYIVNILS